MQKWVELFKVYPKGSVEAKRIKQMLGWRYSGIQTRCRGGTVNSGKPSDLNYFGLEFPKTRQSFYDWALRNESFWILVELWISSGFDKDLSPSIDRIDSKLGYVFSNMRWFGWKKHCQLSGHIGKRLTVRNHTGFIGVSFKPNRKSPYFSYVKINQKIKGLGFYKTAEEAARIRDKEIIKHFGSESILNFPTLT